MLIPIPTGMSYTSTMVATTVKPVTCEHCHSEFVYFLTRRAVGHGSSPLFVDNQGAASRAQHAASRQLHAALERGSAIVPCPNCGKFQIDMIRQSKHKLLINLAATAAVSLVLFGFLWNLNTPPFGTLSMVWWGLPGFILLLLLLAAAFTWALLHDMNAAAPRRKPSPKTMLRSQFEALLAAQTPAAPPK